MKEAIKVGLGRESTIFCSNGAKNVDQGNLLQNRMEGFGIVLSADKFNGERTDKIIRI